MFECNIFENYADMDCSNVVHIHSILKGIGSGRWKEKVLAVRSALPDLKKVEKEKKRLPAVTFPGVFHERVDDGCAVYNKIMIVDIDKISKTKLSALKKKLKTIPWIYSFFDGPSKGIKILIFMDSVIEWHNTHAFYYIEDLFKEMFDVAIDPSGKNVSRLCFVSYDPDIYINPDPHVLHIEKSDKIMSFDSFNNNFKGGNIVYDAKKIFEISIKMVKKSRVGSYRKGNRNNYIFVLSCLMCEFGVMPETTLTLAYEKYSSLGPKEVKAAVGSAYRKCQNNFGKRTLSTKYNNQKSLL